VRTRVGFGAGLSYAQHIPYSEAIDQQRSGSSGTKLIQYLDPTIDISVGDLFGWKDHRDTYVGLGVSHRSGVFKAVQLYDNVYGGSNYIYTYVEWRM
jgi:outer membrane protein